MITFDEEYQHLIEDFIVNHQFGGSENELDEKIELLPEKFKFFFSKVKEIKEDLKDFKILQKNKRGLNVVVAFSNEEEKEKIISYCKEKKLEFSECPRYIRVNKNAISIEVKRLL